MTEMEVATAIKTKMVEKYPSDMWQVIVGRNFGCFCEFNTQNCSHRR